MTQIIIVDDEVEILLPLEQMLTQEGYHVSAFSSSLAAQAHLQQHSVDLALFDIKMPEMDGFSLLKSVRAKMPNLPIIPSSPVRLRPRRLPRGPASSSAGQ